MQGVIDDMNQVQLWPVIMGWIIVVCMFIFQWRRQALIAAAGMTLVTIMVLAASGDVFWSG